MINLLAVGGFSKCLLKELTIASVIGVFDFASYVGAAISTYVLGKVLASAGFAPLPGIWLGAAPDAVEKLASPRPSEEFAPMRYE